MNLTEQEITDAKHLINQLKANPQWPGLVKYLKAHVPELTPYKGEDADVEEYKRVSYQREGIQRIFNVLGVKYA